MSPYLDYPVQCFITLKVGKLFLIIKQRIKHAYSKVVMPVNLTIPGKDLEGLSGPTSSLQIRLCVL